MTPQEFYDKWMQEDTDFTNALCELFTHNNVEYTECAVIWKKQDKMRDDFLDMIEDCLIACPKSCYFCEKYKPNNDGDHQECNATNDNVNPMTWIHIKE